MAYLVLVRHGQSQWNLENRFTGWTDVPLSERGEQDAHKTGQVLKEKDFKFDMAFAARLIRGSDTLRILLEELGQTDIPVEYDSALNERHYGSLQGLNKAETAEKYGDEKVATWRRGFDTRPPDGESIKDCIKRVTPYFTQYVLPHVHKGKNVLVATHHNSMRPIARYLENLSDEDTAKTEYGLCVPYVYQFEGEKMAKKETIEVPGIITKYAWKPKGG